MSTNKDLEMFKNKIENGEVEKVGEVTVISSDNVSHIPNNDEEDVVFAGMSEADIKTEASSEVNTRSIEDEFSSLIRDNMKDIASGDVAAFDAKHDEMLKNILEYRKSLIIKNGFTNEEADAAARSRITRESTEANNKYLEDNPNLAIVKIDKSKSEEVSFTEEEKNKLTKAKAIRLVEVEDSALLSIDIKTSPSDDVLFNAIHKASCNVSKYSMPMLNTYDNCEFSGATTIQLVQAVYDENDSDYRRYQAQLELVYAKFQGSTTMDKYDIEGNTIMSKEDFAKWFRFHDMPVAMYSIYVASSTESIQSKFTCSECEEEYDFTYNTKQLITYPEIPDNFKNDLDTILKYNEDRTSLTNAKEDNHKGKRFKSQFTNNIYDISAPSVARALNVLRYVNPRDSYARYLSLYAMMFEAIYVFDPNDNKYFKIDVDSPRTILSFLYDIVDTELKLITKVINDFYYVPTFELKRKCPKCGNEETVTFSIDELVFLKAQGSEAEIE